MSTDNNHRSVLSRPHKDGCTSGNGPPTYQEGKTIYYKLQKVYGGSGECTLCLTGCGRDFLLPYDHEDCSCVANRIVAQLKGFEPSSQQSLPEKAHHSSPTDDPSLPSFSSQQSESERERQSLDKLTDKLSEMDGRVRRLSTENQSLNLNSKAVFEGESGSQDQKRGKEKKKGKGEKEKKIDEGAKSEKKKKNEEKKKNKEDKKKKKEEEKIKKAEDRKKRAEVKKMSKAKNKNDVELGSKRNWPPQKTDEKGSILSTDSGEIFEKIPEKHKVRFLSYCPKL